MTETIALAPEQIQAFRAEGFIVLPQIAPPEEIARMRGIFERLFREKVGWEMGAQYDLVGTDAAGRPPGLPQISKPARFAPELRGSRYFANAFAIARQLLGPETSPWFDHAILKPPGYGAATPWHQDEAHRNDPGTHYDQISIWMPLQPATVENGCMQFLSGTHRGPVLAHQSPHSDPRIMALECTAPFDPAQATACPLPPGGATLHHCRTLHGAGANVSDMPRYAYILAFRGPSRPDPSFTGFAWNTEKHTAAQARRRAWENRGGVVGRATRKLAAGFLRALRAVRGKVGRSLRS